MDFKCLNLFVLYYAIIVVIRYINGHTTVVPPDESCFQCICEMITGCNLTLGCNSRNECGPFQMTKPFWIDSGNLILEKDDVEIPGAFARCANDPFCARRSIESYFNKFARDCNVDGRIDCDDYVLIHQHGGFGGCMKKSLSPEKLTNFNNCKKGIKVP